MQLDPAACQPLSIAEHVPVKVAQFGLFSDLFEHELLQPTGIEIGQAFVDADRQNLPAGEQLIQRKGYYGMGLIELFPLNKAPKGSFYRQIPWWQKVTFRSSDGAGTRCSEHLD